MLDVGHACKDTQDSWKLLTRVWNLALYVRVNRQIDKLPQLCSGRFSNCRTGRGLTRYLTEGMAQVLAQSGSLPDQDALDFC